MKTTIHIQGECTTLDNSPLKEIKLSWLEAHVLVNLICKKEKLPKHYVEFSNRKTKHRYGAYMYPSYRIVLYVPIGGNNVHVLLHEIAHIKSIKHDDVFKKFQKKLIEKYGKMFI